MQKGTKVKIDTGMFYPRYQNPYWRKKHSKSVNTGGFKKIISFLIKVLLESMPLNWIVLLYYLVAHLNSNTNLLNPTLKNSAVSSSVSELKSSYDIIACSTFLHFFIHHFSQKERQRMRRKNIHRTTTYINSMTPTLEREFRNEEIDNSR